MERLRIGGMTCSGCQNKIEKKLRGTTGVLSAEVSYVGGTAAVTYDADVVTMREIEAVIEKLDYRVLDGGDRTPAAGEKAAALLVIIFAAYVLLNQFGLTAALNIFPTARDGMGRGMLFVVGLLTSVHCAAMCGGINLSQCLNRAGVSGGGGVTAALRPSLLYNLGRVAAYTAGGAVVGALGSVFTLTGALRGAVQLAAGAFMVIMGVNMLGVFPFLRRLAPRLPGGLARRLDAGKDRSKSPLIVGLLNGLMPCGPLQAMQLYALSTGSPATGALSMLMFGLGTVPLMFGVGALSSLLSRKFARKAATVGAALIVVFGLSMVTQGWSLSGFSFGFLSGGNAEAYEAVVEDGFQTVRTTLRPGRYPAITVRAGLPVRWTIDAPQGSVNGCNNRIIIPGYGVERELTTGENVIEFTPTEAGRFPYSCWMGMIRSAISVVEYG
jgi:sulfite exporter TauE/SafE/copper chaperone CopZ